MQWFDSRNEFRGQRKCRFECSPARSACVCRCPAVEAEPRMDIGQHAPPVDEVRDPGRAFPKVDRDLAVRAESQELTLDRARRPGRTCHRGGYSLHWLPVGSMPPSPPPEHVAPEVSLLNAVVGGANTAVAERRAGIARVAGRNCGTEFFD